MDKAIVNIDGVSIENGIMEYNTEEAAVIRHMLSISQTKMVLAEYRKFNEMAMNVICPAAQIDVIVTDWNLSLIHIYRAGVLPECCAVPAQSDLWINDKGGRRASFRFCF